MSALGANPRAHEKIDGTLADVATAIAEALSGLVGQPVVVTPGPLLPCQAAQLRAGLTAAHVVARAAFDGHADQALRTVLPARAAITLAALTSLQPESIIDEQRQAAAVSAEMLEAFGEVANVLGSAIDGALRNRLAADVGLRAKDHGVIQAGTDPQELLGDGPCIAQSLTLQVGDYPTDEIMLLLDPETAEHWNGEALTFSADAAVAPAPIRGKLSAFLVEPDLFDPIRLACRSVGLELVRHARTEIPNPAAHVGQVVVMDVTAAESRRFEWCRRLKAFDSQISVVLLIHHPTRSRVLQGFVAGADVILGTPVTDAQLVAKLGPLLDSRAAT